MPTCPKGHESAADDYCDVCGARIAGPVAATTASGRRPEPSGRAAPARTCPACGAALDGRFCEECGQDSLAAATGTPVTTTAAAGTAAMSTAVASTAAATTAEPATAEPAGPMAATAQPATAQPAGSVAGAPVGVDGSAAVPSPAAQSRGAAARVGADGPADASRDGGSGVAVGVWEIVVTADREYFDRMQALRGPDAGAVEFPRFLPERRFTLVGSQVLIGRRSRSRGIHPEIDLTGPPEDGAVSHLHALLVPLPEGGWAAVDLKSTNYTYLNGSPQAIEPETPIPLRAGDYVNVGAWTRLTLRWARE